MGAAQRSLLQDLRDQGFGKRTEEIFVRSEEVGHNKEQTRRNTIVLHLLLDQVVGNSRGGQKRVFPIRLAVTVVGDVDNSIQRHLLSTTKATSRQKKSMYCLSNSLNRLCAHPVLRSHFHFKNSALPLPILQQIRGMKRKATSPEPSARKAVKVDDYCSVQTKKGPNGDPIWPAPEEQIISARKFLREWYVHESKFRIM